MQFGAKRVLVSLLVIAMLAGCGLPRSGPTESELRASDVEKGGDVNIVDVDSRVAAASRVVVEYGFSREFVNAGNITVERIEPGDSLTITVWENVENGLFSSAGRKVTNLPNMTVDSLGNIFMPYAGTIRASGRTPEELRLKITDQLAMQTPDPQVEVRRTAGTAASVYVIGGNGGQGVYPIRTETRRLTQMLASIGGLAVDPSRTKVTVQRRGLQGQAWMHDLIANPAMDIALKPGDRIIVEEDKRYFIAMGTVRQKSVNFEADDPNAIQALASLGGLNGNVANPKGVFVLRTEPAEIANRVLGRTDIAEPQRFAYVLDLTKPSGLFTAQEFFIRNEDILYVTEAPYVAWRNLLSVFIGSVNSVSSLDNAVDKLANIAN